MEDDIGVNRFRLLVSGRSVSVVTGFLSVVFEKPES